MKRTIEQKSEQCELVCNQSMFTSLMRYKCNYLTDFKRKFLYIPSHSVLVSLSITVSYLYNIWYKQSVETPIYIYVLYFLCYKILYSR